MSTSSSSSFPQFSRLPAELQLKIWNATGAAEPAMHIFDVCFPSWRGNHRSYKAFDSTGTTHLDDKKDRRWSKYKDTVFLDALDVSDEELSRPTRIARHRVDPSMYKLQDRLRATCVDASSTVGLSVSTYEKGLPNNDINTIYLPGPDRHVRYDNRTDVLHLRFRDGGAVTAFAQDAMENLPDPVVDGAIGPSSGGQLPDGPVTYLNPEMPLSNGISAVLEAVWSSELADTMHNARRIALDVVETWTDSTVGTLIFEEIAFLACTMQHNLEVLYLVDYCIGRCHRCGKRQYSARDLQERGGDVDKMLQEPYDPELGRPPDVIHAVGKTYREVFTLEKLGWSDQHPTCVFARVIDDAIRAQQSDGLDGKICFKGVRILMAEDDDTTEAVDSTIVIDCDHDAALNYSQGKLQGVDSCVEA